VAAASIPIGEAGRSEVKARSINRKRRAEAGIALLIAIFVVLLISVVGIALVVSSGTETALAGNYRSATGVYYASLAGLEEARGRLLAKNPNSFLKTAAANFLPPPGTQWDIGYVRYILNPGPADAADTRTANPDTEYNNEFGSGKLEAADVQTTLSVWNVAPLNALPVPGPLYKWVRINAVSEVSLQRQVAPYGDGHTPDPAKPIYYDGTQLNVSNSGSQVLEITSLAALPNGSQKLLQYLAAPIPVTLPPLPAALTLAGNQTVRRVTYTAPSNNARFFVDGTDHDCNGNSVAGPQFPAIGVFDSSDVAAVLSGIPIGYQPTNYPGVKPSPDVVTVNGAPFPTNLQKPSALDAIVQSIIQNSDAILTPVSTTTPPYTAFGSDLTAATAGMNSSNPMTVVVKGNLDLNGWHNTGYGLLLVTGNLNYDPDASWNGIVLVIGQGTVTGSKGGSGIFLGAFLVANTRDPSGNLWPDPNLGPLSVNFNNGSSMGGNGILYSSCWIQKAQPTSGYNILSFHEISQ